MMSYRLPVASFLNELCPSNALKKVDTVLANALAKSFKAPSTPAATTAQPSSYIQPSPSRRDSLLSVGSLKDKQLEEQCLWEQLLEPPQTTEEPSPAESSSSRRDSMVTTCTLKDQHREEQTLWENLFDDPKCFSSPTSFRRGAMAHVPSSSWNSSQLSLVSAIARSEGSTKRVRFVEPPKNKGVEDDQHMLALDLARGPPKHPFRKASIEHTTTCYYTEPVLRLRIPASARKLDSSDSSLVVQMKSTQPPKYPSRKASMEM
jgi:hypothetical protein